MPEVHPTDEGSRRVWVTLVGMVLAITFLVSQLWKIQVARGASYQDAVYEQTIRRVRLPGFRGRILDRHGVALADNRPSYAIALFVNEFRQPGGWDNTIDAVERKIEELADIVDMPALVSRKDIAAHVSRRLPLPLLAWRDVGHAAMAQVAERQLSLPGVDIYVEPVRVYPQQGLAAHIVGYARGRRDAEESWPPQDEHGRIHFYLPELRGERGIEKVYNSVLAGEAGGRQIRVDASGYVHKLVDDEATTRERAPERGRDVYLSIDVDVQRYAEECLTNVYGAVVVLDPRNGDVLALANAPGFDPNAFVPTISFSAYQKLLHHPGHPLVNRAVSGYYPPGSTFKPIVAIAALENGEAGPEQVYHCPGFYALGRQRLKCWIMQYNKGHGDLAMRKAFEQSCNTYFCELGVHVGYQAIYHTARAMGLGRKVHIGLDNESAGHMPSPDRIRSRGDLANVSIGQGAIAVTPLQMALVTATIANGGRVYRPRLILYTKRPQDGVSDPVPSELIEDLEWSASTISVVRNGMRDVVQAPTGTGKRARLEGVEMGGKTGTAEYGKKEEGKKRGWMIAFAPYDEPRYAVAMVIDDVVSGGITVAPRLKQLMQRLLFPFGGELPVVETQG